MLRKLKWGDAVIIAAVLLGAAVLAAVLAVQTASDRLYAEVWRGSELIERVALTDTTEQTIEVDGHNMVILSGKTARMAQADCRDQVCVRTGTLMHAGQVAVCLPNKVIVKLVGASSEVDVIVS